MKMKLSLIHYLAGAVVILAIISGISTYKLIQEQERNTALEASVKIHEKHSEDLLQQNFDLIDLIDLQKKARAEVIEKRDQKIDNVLANFEQLLNTIPENEKAVDNMRDTDSIYQLFTRYHPDHTGAGKAGN